MEWKHGFKKIAKVRSFKFAWWLLLLNCYIFIPQEIFLSNLVFYAHEPWERVHERVWKNIRNISFCVFSWLSLCIACFPNCISTFFVTFFPLSLCLALSFLDMFLFLFFSFQVYIHGGSLHVIPMPHNTGEVSTFPLFTPTVEEAVAFVRNPNLNTRASQPIQDALSRRLNRYLVHIFAWFSQIFVSRSHGILKKKKKGFTCHGCYGACKEKNVQFCILMSSASLHLLYLQHDCSHWMEPLELLFTAAEPRCKRTHTMQTSTSQSLWQLFWRRDHPWYLQLFKLSTTEIQWNSRWVH